MAKKNKSKASHTLVDLDQPLVKNEAQEVITCTESEPCMPDVQETSTCAELELGSTADEQREPVCAELERCSTADEQREPVCAELELGSTADEQREPVCSELELEPATEAQEPPVDMEQESASDEQNELVPDLKINDEEDAPHPPEQEPVHQAVQASPADQQDDQQEPDKLLESVTPQIKKKQACKISMEFHHRFHRCQRCLPCPHCQRCACPDAAAVLSRYPQK